MFRTIRSKLIFYFLLAGVVPALTVATFSYFYTISIEKEKAAGKLEQIRNASKAVAVDYLNQLQGQVLAAASSDVTPTAFSRLRKAFFSYNRAAALESHDTDVRDYFTQVLAEQLKLPEDKKSAFVDKCVSNDALTLYHQAYLLANQKNKYYNYNALLEQADQQLSGLRQLLQCRDLMLLDFHTGYILYSSRREADLAANIKHGLYASSPLKKVYEKVRDGKQGTVAISDFVAHSPSQNIPVMFVGAPFYQDGKPLGILVAKVEADGLSHRINNGGQWSDAGLGETGETYLFAVNGIRTVPRAWEQGASEFLLSMKVKGASEEMLDRIKQNETPVLSLAVNAEATRMALAGKTGVMFGQNYQQKDVLSAYAPLEANGLKWGIVTEIHKSEAMAGVVAARSYILLMSLAVVVAGAFLAMLIAGLLSTPFAKLMKAIKVAETGNFKLEIKGADETAQVATYINKQQEKIQEQESNIRQQAQQIESEAAAKEAVAQQLTDTKKGLEEKLDEQELHLVRQLKKVSTLSEKLEALRKQLLTNENFAKQQQSTCFPELERVQRNLPNTFVFHRQKDVISQSYYWFEERGTRSFLLVADKLGDGVKGAFMTVTLSQLLYDIVSVNRISTADRILDELHKRLYAVRQVFSDVDPLAVSLCVFDFQKGILEYAGADRPLYYIKDGKLTVINGDEIAAGGDVENGLVRYTNHLVPISRTSTDSFYLSIGGIVDQEGEDGAVFGEQRFQEVLLDIHNLSMAEQQVYLAQVLDEWRQDLSQTSDILLLGVQLP
ncbi:SpoIIE family protein phosphatase [Limibacter armeniacum]|uniref:SpoIIE family protein phosphatase n=1 Tax=Limibacter armeniacum TaxID=466084 RepID=UPI002FE5BAB7